MNSQLFALHVSAEKRKYITSIVTTTIFLSILTVLSYSYVGTLEVVLYCLMLVSGVVAVLLIRRVDYYLDDILGEILVIFSTLTTLLIVALFWSFSIQTNVAPIFMRIMVVLVPVTIGIIQVYIFRTRGVQWMPLIVVLLIVVKWVIVPYWGLFSLFSIILYSVLASYVSEWMISTTRTEMVFSKNISPAKVVFALVIGACLLVLAI